MVALSPAESERIAALEAQITALREEQELARKYDISTPELLQFAKEQERQAEEQRARNREAVRRHREAQKRRDARRQELVSELIADGRIRLYTGPDVAPARVAPVDGALPCPVCGAPSSKMRELAADTLDQIAVSNDILSLDLGRWPELVIQHSIRFPAIVKSNTFTCPACKQPYGARSLVVPD